MKSNKILKFSSLTLSSIIFSISVLHPVYASRVHTKRMIFSDSIPLAKRLAEEEQNAEVNKEAEVKVETKTKVKTKAEIEAEIEAAKIIDLNDIFKFDENPRKKSGVCLIGPTPVNKFKICKGIENLENEVYGKKLYVIKKSRCYEDIFYVDLCTDITFKELKPYNNLNSFKSCVRKFYGKSLGEDQLIPLNVAVYFYAMSLLPEICNAVKKPDFYNDELWSKYKMNSTLDRFQCRIERLVNLVLKGKKILFSKFNCDVESIIELLFNIRDFYKSWEDEYGLSVDEGSIENIDTAIAALSYVSESIIM